MADRTGTLTITGENGVHVSIKITQTSEVEATGTQGAQGTQGSSSNMGID